MTATTKNTSIINSLKVPFTRETSHDPLDPLFTVHQRISSDIVGVLDHIDVNQVGGLFSDIDIGAYHS